MTEHNSPREIEHLNVPPPLPRSLPANLPVFDRSTDFNNKLNYFPREIEHLDVPPPFPCSLPCSLCQLDEPD